MPQLDPKPWLFILVLSWSIFIAFVPPKVLAYIFPNEPTHQQTKNTKASSWDWPWH
nr:ATP synthase F0 subunit 8 [Moolgarda engeli]WNH21352.1 ATP synthase F0 subunit 8 [Moolgarda engeli]